MKKDNDNNSSLLLLFFIIVVIIIFIFAFGNKGVKNGFGTDKSNSFSDSGGVSQEEINKRIESNFD